MLLTGGLLLVGELRHRAAAEPMQTMPVVPAQALPQPLATQALTLALGIRPADPSASQLALTLKACFTSSLGESRALVASADGQAIYRVGDELPGGARLRQVDKQSVTLWFNGAEQRLNLVADGQSVLRPVASGEAGPTPSLPSPRLLREVP
ncbi:protein XcpP [Pseudomonas fakonensis]|uniref:Protein XcpP n=1 Tax=Pseudomonas fakonensis TaxID=2842355 RepID=A0ABX8N4D6_9PSED|nr:type II secretion system protein N [Pseudomonas fakonensis]QXH51211.1 protein XcpP [Pseudomonas fakonensis]